MLFRSINMTTGVIEIPTGYTLTGPMVAGQADFPSLIPNFFGTGFRLRVEVAGATSALSQPFDVVR